MFSGEARPTGAVALRVIRGRRTWRQWLTFYARSLGRIVWR